jgi:hypothetical protein
MRLRCYHFLSYTTIYTKLCKASNMSFYRTSVTPGFKGQIRVHLIYAPEKTTRIIIECIEINVINIINVLIT